MSEIDLLGYVFYAIIFLGSWLIAHKRKGGFLYRALGDLVWAGIGLATGLTSLLVAKLISVGIDVFGFFRWKQDGNLCTKCKKEIE